MRGRKNTETERDRRQFSEDVYKEMQEEILHRMEEGEEAEFTLTRKNNGIMLHACTIRYGENRVAPTLYLENFLKESGDEKKIPEKVEELLQCGRSSRNGIAIPENFFERYEEVVPHLGIRLVNYDRNRDMLREAAFKRVEDLAATFFYMLEDPVMGAGTIRIGRQETDRWGISADRIFKDAAENSIQMLPLKFASLSAMSGVHSGGTEVFVLTNERGVYGASVILYPRVLSVISDALGGDLWLLPSSVHEFLFLRCRGEDPAPLLEIVRTVNRSTVSAEDFLSDSVYRYRREEDRIERISG